jgi:hypothetical protein
MSSRFVVAGLFLALLSSELSNNVAAPFRKT